MNKSRTLPLIALATSLLAGCQSIGPRSVSRDRTNYGSAIAESWKEQTLLNIVKLRYSDPPIFMDVGQIVSGYQFDVSATVGGTLSGGLIGGNTGNGNLQGHYIDRPTITYTPLTGSRFINGLVTPISPTALFNAIQAGWPADVILSMGTHAINGLRNERRDGENYEGADPNFLRVLALMRDLQLSGAISTRISETTDRKPPTLLAVRIPNMPEERRSEVQELCRLLQIDENAAEFQLSYGAISTGTREIAIQTRSLLNILTSLSLHIDLPPGDIADGRARPGVEGESPATKGLRIHSSKDKPDDAFVAVHYHDHWFSIDDRDLTTKRALSLIMLLFTMADTGPPGSMPVLTIPTS